MITVGHCRPKSFVQHLVVAGPSAAKVAQSRLVCGKILSLRASKRQIDRVLRLDRI